MAIGSGGIPPPDPPLWNARQVRFFYPREVMVYTTTMQPNAKYYGAAAQYNRPGGSSLGRLLKLAGLVVGIILLLFGGFLAYNFITSSGKNTAAQLVARQKQLLSFATINQETINNDMLKTINSNAVSLLSSDSYALQQGLKSVGLAMVPEAITKSEADATSAKTLASAKVQDTFDQVYLELLREKIAATESLARTVQGNGSLKAATQTLLTNLSAIDNQLSKLQL